MKRLIPLILFLFVVPMAASAQEEQEGSTEPKSPYKPFDTVTEGAELIEGYFDFYVKGDQLIMAVPEARLGEDFLMTAEIAQGYGSGIAPGGTMLNLFEGLVVSIEKHGDKLFLMQRPHRFSAPEGTPEAASVALTFGSSVLDGSKIETIRDDDAVLVNVGAWFVSDLSGVSQRVRFAAPRQGNQPGRVSLDKSRSFVESVKSFPMNSSVRAKLTFGSAQGSPLPSIPDGRFIPISIHYNIAALPAEPMQPRLADDRTGFFITAHKSFADDDSTFFRRYANRWRLEPGERVGDKWRPKKPIVYHIDPTIPERYHDYFKRGVEAWQVAFEAAGWVDAIKAEPLPEGADAEDIRYATMRWNTSDTPAYGAIGPSTVDPRTGEIIDADLLFEANFFRGAKLTYRTTVDPVALLEQGFANTEAAMESIRLNGGQVPITMDAIAAQSTYAWAALVARGTLGPGEPVPEDYVEQFMIWTVMHEVGHSLGLEHNFASSRATPMDKLHDRAWAETNGLVASVMDYHAPNVALPGETQGYYYTPGVGSADRWMISYGYTPDDARAAELAREAANPRHPYGTSIDFGGPGAMDPTINTWDLGEDPLAWGLDRAASVSRIWGELPNHVLTDNTRYLDLTNAYLGLLGAMSQALVPAVKYVGGQYMSRDHVGDDGARPPFTTVDRAKQLEALDFVLETVFSEDAFNVPSDVLAQFGPNRWNHWGTNSTFQGRIDYPFHEQVLGFQRSLMNQLTHPFKFSRIRDAEYRFGAERVVTIPEIMSRITESVWTEAWRAPGRDASTSRRDLQRAWVARLAEILETPPSRMPADARAVARVQLQQIRDQLGRRLSPPANFDAYTTAHYQEMRQRIEKILSASYDVSLD